MKKQFHFRSLIVLLTAVILLLACRIPAGRAEGNKPEGDLSFSIDSFSGTYVCNYEGDERMMENDLESGYALALYPKGEERTDENREDAIRSSLTLISGDEKLKDALQIYQNDLRTNVKNLDAEGEAVYLLEVESEHFCYSGEITANFVDFRKITLTRLTDTIMVSPEERYYINGRDFISAAVKIEPDAGEVMAHFLEEDDAAGAYEIDGRNFIGHTGGDYLMTVVFELGVAGREVGLPYTFHVRTEAEEEEAGKAEEEARKTEEAPPEEPAVSEVGDVITDNNGQLRFLGVTSRGSFSGTETVNAKCSNIDERSEFRNCWVYVPSTVPEEIMAYRLIAYPRLSPLKGEYRSVYPTSYSAEFISGDEHLRNALRFDDYPRNDNPDDRWYILYADDQCLTKPGQAVFRIRMAGEGLYYETEYTLKVLSWTEEPLFDLTGGQQTANARGGSVKAPVYDSGKIAALFLKDHYAELAGAHPEAVAGRYSAPLYVYTSEKYDESQVKTGYTWTGEIWQFLDYGSYKFNLQYQFGNISFYMADLSVNVLPYSIRSRGISRPGGSVQLGILDEQPESGRTFTWTLEGDGLELDPETLILSIPETVPEGTVFSVTAAPSDGGEPVTSTGTVYSGALAAPVFDLESSGVGFSVPTLANEGFSTAVSGYDLISYTEDQVADYMLLLRYSTNQIMGFREDPEAARQYYDESVASLEESGTKVAEQKEVMIGGHPARLLISSLADPDNTGLAGYTGYVEYVRNNIQLLAVLATGQMREETSAEDVPPVLMSDLEKIAANISYNPARAPYTLDDCAVTVTAKDGATALTAGKKLQLAAAFGNPDKVNKKAKNDGVTWSAVSAETGEAVEGITIDAKGTLTAAKTITDVHRIKVTAYSDGFGTSGVTEITVIPAAEKISLDKTELYFYTGEDRTETVSVILEPATVPPVGLIWTEKKAGIAEIIPDVETGRAAIRALAPGKTTVTVREPGGKKADLNIVVADPVTGVELTAKGKAIPGGNVTVTAVLTPKKPGNPALEWSLDVGEDIAVINGGKIKISKTAPVGTVITVTCRALGAPVPPETALKIEITEK